MLPKQIRASLWQINMCALAASTAMRVFASLRRGQAEGTASFKQTVKMRGGSKEEFSFPLISSTQKLLGGGGIPLVGSCSRHKPCWPGLGADTDRATRSAHPAPAQLSNYPQKDVAAALQNYFDAFWPVGCP